MRKSRTTPQVKTPLPKSSGTSLTAGLGWKSFIFRAVGVGIGSVGLLALFASPISGQDTSVSIGIPQEFLDNLWVIIAAVLVFLMQAGFGFLEAGLTRAKNVANIMAKNLADMSVGTISFFILGYGIAFGTDAGNLIGTDMWFLSGSDSSFNGGLSTYTEFFFQAVFAATAVTVASGAMAERTKFSGYLIFSAVMSLFIYPVVVHSLWSGDGILADITISGAGFHDFAGSTVVHSTGGWAAMMGATFLGPRIGKYADTGPSAIPGHNIAFTVVGVFILWFGWFGFNAGSQLAFDEVAVHSLMTTLLAAGAGTLVSGMVIWKKTKAVDVAMIGNGVLAGLVSITAGTVVMNPLGALITGGIAGFIVVHSVFFFDRIRIDDPVGAISVHAICGVWGTLAVGLFASVNTDVLGGNRGLFYGGGIAQLGVQLFGVVIVFSWVTISTGILFGTLSKLNLLRVSRSHELKGLDISEHGSRGYGPEVALDETQVPRGAFARELIRYFTPRGASKEIEEIWED